MEDLQAEALAVEAAAAGRAHLPESLNLLPDLLNNSSSVNLKPPTSVGGFYYSAITSILILQLIPSINFSSISYVPIFLMGLDTTIFFLSTS